MHKSGQNYVFDDPGKKLLPILTLDVGGINISKDDDLLSFPFKNFDHKRPALYCKWHILSVLAKKATVIRLYCFTYPLRPKTSCIYVAIYIYLFIFIFIFKKT